MDLGLDSVTLFASVAKVLFVAVVLLHVTPIMVWVERRGSAFIQLRRGPNRVGPLGLLQPLADGLKFLFKQDIVPPFVHRPVYVLAPLVSLLFAFMAFAVIPFGGTLEVAGRSIALVVADFDGSILMLLGMAGLGVYGIVMAGWASNNKYAQLGGLRSSAQMVSYELALGLGVITALVIAGSLRMTDIVAYQQANGWNVFQGYGLGVLGFLVLLIAGYAETNRLPFDLPEAESELVAGYHTEYSSMKFAMFFMAEYTNMFTSSALVVTLYLGGYLLPFQSAWGLEGNALALAQVGCFLAKVALFMWLYVWVRWTLPRFRYDQLMRLGWKGLIPAGFAVLVLVSLMSYWGLIR